jgi:hypothetical protein
MVAAARSKTSSVVGEMLFSAGLRVWGVLSRGVEEG